jgi:RNA polymerase sigma-70 factor (subfamily 1)
MGKNRAPRSISLVKGGLLQNKAQKTPTLSAIKVEVIMSVHAQAVNPLLERWRAYLECLTHIHVGPRFRGRFGLSDIVQKTILKAWRNMDRIQELDPQSQQHWLRGKFNDTLIDQIREEQAACRDYRREHSMDESLEMSSYGLRNWLTEDETTPLEKLAERERALRLVDALTQLPERQREALILQRWHGWKLREIADHLECTTNAVAGLLAHGVDRLRQLLPEDLLD